MKYFAAILLLCSQPLWADSTRIEVYPISQNYRDVHAGDTLGEIATELLPDTPNLRQRLMHEIIELNPDAFIGGDPDRMRSNMRLWLPNSLEHSAADAETSTGTVEHYLWGSITRAKK
jgi:Tfp pilus assembly protein FimV